MISITANQLTGSRYAPAPATPTAGLPARIKRLLTFARNAFEVSVERRQLSKLSDEQLRDIGISRAQMAAESRRSFLDIPKR